MVNQQRAFLCTFLLLLVSVAAMAQSGGDARPVILLSNDDGYDAPGIKALISGLRPLGDIRVSAPASEFSGVGHGLTLRAPVMVNERKQAGGETWYAVEGPPATCVRLAVESLLPVRPEIVISGINRGDNLGTTVYHSGTMGAAREAALVGIPAIAVSIRGDAEADYAAAADFTRQLVVELRAKKLVKPGLFLNVNVPAGERKGVRVTRLSMTPRPDLFERRVSPLGRVYYWPNWRQLDDDVEGTDVWALVRGYITITPMMLDVTARDGLKALEVLKLEIPAGRANQ